MTEPKLPSRGAVAFGALLAIAFLVGGISDLADTIALHRSSNVVDAQVIEYRVMQSAKYGVSHELRYVFSETPNAPPIGRVGFLNDNLWASLPEPQWREAIETGHVAVKYDSSKRGNNAPAVELPKITDSSVPVVVGSFLLFCVVFVEIKRMRRRENKPAPAH